MHLEANITGTSDYLDTAIHHELIQAVNPDVKKIGLLYDIGQDSSTTAIQEAKDYLDKEGHRICRAYRYHNR